MYIIGIDQADLSRDCKAYKIAIANRYGKIVKAYSFASEEMLQKILNHPNLTDPCVWSEKELAICKKLTDRNIIELRNYHVKRNAITKNIKDITPLFIFNRTARQLKFKNFVSKEESIRYDLPPMIIYKDQKGRADQYLSSLCYNTLLLSKVQTYDDLFKTDKKKK